MDFDCISPSSYDGSGPSAFQTPETTPSSSPIKRCDTPLLGHLDGGCDQADLDVEEVRIGLKQAKTRSPVSYRKLGKLRPPKTPRRYAVSKITDSPDRFILGRSWTPNKERMILADHSTKSSSDPFSPQPRRTLAVDQFFTVVKFPFPAVQRYGRVGTSVTRSTTTTAPQRWTVAGLPVTEGVASTTNGRGGRVTSGTNAPLYNANMMQESEKAWESAAFKARLALAMDIDLDSKMLPSKAASAAVTAHKTEWKDCQWQASQPAGVITTPSKPPSSFNTLPFKVLDAPELRNDYYCSLLAYCPVLKCIAVGLNNHVYIWCDPKAVKPAGIRNSIVFPREWGHITSLSFSSKAGGKTILAVGRSCGKLRLMSALDQGPRLQCDQPRPVTHVSFRPCPSKRQSMHDGKITVMTEELLVGTEDGTVLLYSVEWPEPLFNRPPGMMLRAIITCHNQQICGIAWTQEGETFATGGNDNQLYVHDFAKLQSPSLLIDGRTHPVHRTGLTHALLQSGNEKQRFTLNAAVKAVAFAPWQPSLVAASGGSNDRCIHFLHTSSGARLATINCHAQVTSLTWHSTRREIAATLGFTQPDHPVRIVTFAWPSCEQLSSISWHNEERALYSISYPRPDGPKKEEALVVATSDHSIKFHEVWHEGKKGAKKTAGYAKSQILSDVCSDALESEMEIR